ncbi:MAG: gliding motility-associated C-terminal domain-containing protein [Bacteroidales bacterium]|nr:gliding motility-associated C-terminal domain-containing protein [Bacteroidales bacterium]
MKTAYGLLFSTIVFCASLKAQTFSNNTPYSIPDNNTSGVYSDINVSGISPLAIAQSVTININHTWVGDLYIYLVDPLNNEHLLCGGRGGSGDNFINTVFRNDASVSITLGSAPFTGTFIPEQPIPRGVNPNGRWRLHVIDTYPTDVGSIQNWSITFAAPPCPVVGIHTSPTSGISTLTCRDSVYILPNDSSVAGGAIYPTLYFQFNTGANAAKNAVTIFENGQVIFQRNYGQMQTNTQLTVYFPGPGADPTKSYSIQVCNQDGTAPMPWVVYDGNGTTHASGTTPTGCTNYGSWSPMGQLSWTISPNVSGLYYAPWGLAGFWPDECGPGTYTITYNWNNQGTGAYACSGSASLTFTVTNPWNASWNSPGTVCASGGPINLASYITGNSGGTFSGPGVSGNTFNPAGLSGAVNITYTVGNSQYCYASQTRTITVLPLATANAGPNASICAGQNYTISGASYGGSATGCTWTTSGTGTFINGNTTTPTYIPSQADIAAGQVTLTISTTGPCAPATSSMLLTINSVPNASFSYGTGSFCKTGTNPTPTVSTPGGTFTSNPAGLSINSSTGTINLSASNVGTYTVTYSIGGTCPSSSSVTITITNGFDAQFSYAGPYCQLGQNPLPSHTTGSNGVYTATPSGLVFVNQNTGEINLAASQPGTYLVVNTIPASGGCAQAQYSSTVVIEQAPTVNAGPDITICSNTSAQITGATFGGSATSVQWTTNGSGTLINAGTLTPTYIPSANDAINGVVTLTITTNDPPNTCPAVSDQMMIIINQSSQVEAGNNQTICEGDVVSLNASIGGATTSIVWTSSGNGIFTNNVALNTSYIPSANDIQTGYVYLYVTANDPDGNGPCTIVKDSIYVQINKKATVTAGNNLTICEGEQVPLNAVIGGTATSVQWTTTGTGTFTNANVPTTAYIPSAADIANGSVQLIVATNDPDGSGPCGQAKDTIIVTIYPKPIISQIISNPVTSCTTPNGSIEIQATSTYTPLTYSIDNGNNYSSSNIYTNLNSGIYYVVVKNSVGCTASQSVTIQNTQGPQILSVEAINPLCFGQNNGQIIIHATNVSTYVVNGVQSTDSVFSNLSPGTYSIIVIDNADCQATTQVTLTQPQDLVVNTFKQHVQCFGQQNGSITVVVQGGTSPYTYLWNNGANTSLVQNLSAGIYVVTVTDANGCSKVKVDTINQPTMILVNLNVTQPTCSNSNNGSIQAIVSGGASNYQYMWSNGNSSPFINNLPAGNYSLTITDANGCTQTAQTTLVAPSAINAQANISQITCFNAQNGSIQLTVSGGTGTYSYMWSNQATTASLNNLGPGAYVVTITDQNLCTGIYSYTITQPAELQVSHPQSGTLCNGAQNGFIILNVTGGVEPYTYAWSNGQTVNSLQNLAPGNYTFTVTDANGCTYSKTITIQGSTPINPQITYDIHTQQATVTTNGGTSPYLYLWNNSQTTNTINLTETGTYSVTVTDANGCTAVASYIHDVPLKIPNCITPNGDRVNDDLEIVNIEAYPKLTIEIYNRWGDLLFRFYGSGTEYADPMNRWKGKFNDKDLPMGPYLFILDLHNDKEPITGTITIVR